MRRISSFKYLAFIKMAQNARRENELSDEDNVSSYLTTSKNVTKSTGRKSFSKRKSLCFDSLVISGSTNIKNAEHQLGVRESGAASTSTEECMQKLKLEKVAWRTMCEERRKTYKTMKEHLNSEPLKLDWDNCADALLDEDKQFLNDHPQYENTVAKMNHVSEMASICMHTKYKSAHMSAKITAIAEQQGVALKKKIFKHAESYYI